MHERKAQLLWKLLRPEAFGQSYLFQEDVPPYLFLDRDVADHFELLRYQDEEHAKKFPWPHTTKILTDSVKVSSEHGSTERRYLREWEQQGLVARRDALLYKLLDGREQRVYRTLWYIPDNAYGKVLSKFFIGEYAGYSYRINDLSQTIPTDRAHLFIAFLDAVGVGKKSIFRTDCPDEFIFTHTAPILVQMAEKKHFARVYKDLKETYFPDLDHKTFVQLFFLKTILADIFMNDNLEQLEDNAGKEVFHKVVTGHWRNLMSLMRKRVVGEIMERQAYSKDALKAYLSKDQEDLKQAIRTLFEGKDDPFQEDFTYL